MYKDQGQFEINVSLSCCKKHLELGPERVQQTVNFTKLQNKQTVFALMTQSAPRSNRVFNL